MSSFKISKLESLLFQELNKNVSQMPPFTLHKELYAIASNHANQVLSKKLKNVKIGYNERKSLFPKAQRYKEMCFVSSKVSSINSDAETSKILCSMILKHYSTEFKSGLNSIGPVLVPLKSNKILVIILAAYFPPFVSASKFKETFEPLSKQKYTPDDKSNFVSLLNTFRSLANFDKLNMSKPKSKSPFRLGKYYYSCTVYYSIQLFQSLMSDCNLYSLLIDYWTNFSIDFTPNPKDDTQFQLTMLFWKYDGYIEYKVDVYTIPAKECIPKKEEHAAVKDNDAFIDVPASSTPDDYAQIERNYQLDQATSSHPDPEMKAALDDLYTNIQQNLQTEPPVIDTPEKEPVSYEEGKEVQPSFEGRIAPEQELFVQDRNVSYDPRDIVIRGAEINLDDFANEDNQPDLLSQEHEIDELRKEADDIKKEIDQETDLENSKDKLDQKTEDYSNQAVKYAEEALKAEKISDNYADQENEAHQNAEKARQLQAQLESQATEEARAAQEASNSLKEALEASEEAHQKAQTADEAVEKLQKDFEAQDQIYKQSEKIEAEAERQLDEADRREQRAIDKAEEATSIDEDISNILTALDAQDAGTQKADALIGQAEGLEEVARAHQGVVERAATVAEDALNAEERILDEIERAKETKKEQDLVMQAEAAKVPELAERLEEARDREERLREDAGRQEEVAKKAENVERDAKEHKHAADLVAAALRRSSELFQAKAEAAEEVEEVLEAEYAKQLDLEIRDEYKDDEEKEKEKEKELPQGYEYVEAIDNYQPENDKVTDKDYGAVPECRADGGNEELARGDEGIDKYAEEAMRLLRQEMEADKGGDAPAEEEAAQAVAEDRQSEIEAPLDFQLVYDEVYQARDTENEPVPECQSARETELATGSSEVSEDVEIEAAKELNESV